MSKIAVGICVAVGAAWFSGAWVSGQERSDVLEALLDEVRQLRVAIETAAATNGRLQVTVQRASIQEERLWRISREVEALRTEIANASEERMSATADVKRLEEELVNVADHEKRRELEQALKDRERNVQRQQRYEKRLQDQESTLSQTLQIEEARWGELNQKLDELERLMNRP
jgi:septal ring factor EnvC (AmiA/AmiB activator)